jgi:CBS domain-containing protein
MQMISEVMTRNVRFVSPQESLQHAAHMMDDLDIGVLPVCDGERLVGMITDRDITVGATSADARVEEAMSADVPWCFEDQTVDEVMQQLAESQIRRVPVVSHDDAHRLVGIVALGDLATKSADVAKKDVEQIENVSFPSEPEQSQEADSANAEVDPDTGEGVPTKGTSAGPGSTHPIGWEAATGLAAPATGAGRSTGVGTGLGGGIHAPARSIADAAGGPSTPADIPPTIAADIARDATSAGASSAAGSEGSIDETEAADFKDAAARAAGTGTADSADSAENTGGSGAPGGSDAAGASGGNAGTAGSDAGAKP